jgi:lysophospholipase L1-like esterase
VSSTSPRIVGRRVFLGGLIALLLVLLAGCGAELPESAARGSDPSAPDTATAPVTTGVPTTTSTLAPTTTSTLPPTTTTTAPPVQVAGSPLPPGPNTVYVLGDSVTLGAAATVPGALVGWQLTFDAKESRRIDQGTTIVQDNGGVMGRVLVVHLCTNWGGGDYGAAAGKLLASLSGVERVVWVTCTPWLPAVGAADAVIRSLPQSHPEVVVADWAAVSGTDGYTYADGLHLKPAGATGLAQVIAAAVGPAPAPG